MIFILFRYALLTSMRISESLGSQIHGGQIMDRLNAFFRVLKHLFVVFRYFGEHNTFFRICIAKICKNCYIKIGSVASQMVEETNNNNVNIFNINIDCQFYINEIYIQGILFQITSMIIFKVSHLKHIENIMERNTFFPIIFYSAV